MKYLFIEETGSYIPEPENYNDVLELINSDYFRMVGKKGSFIKMFLYTFYEPSFKFMFWHRISPKINGTFNTSNFVKSVIFYNF